MKKLDKTKFKSPECPNCRSWPCLNGTDYEELKDGDHGLIVEYVGPDKSISNRVGVVKKLEKGLSVVKLFRKKNNPECQIRDERGICLFKIFCPKPENNNNTKFKSLQVR